MTSTKASVAYKKKDGSLTVGDDRKYLFWTPAAPANAAPTVTIPVTDITNLQQTPESSPKVALKVFVKEDNYVFSFTHKEKARKEQETVTEVLRDTIAASKAASVAPSLGPSKPSNPAQNGEGVPAAMAMAKAVSSKAQDETWYDDNKLKSDFALQRLLLDSDKVLKERFNQALHDKPESVSASQFTTQFWSTRIHLLRSFAIERAQKQGEYNVLPEIRFTRVPSTKEGEGDIKTLNITKEQIKLIFKQYAVVAEAYNDNCPPLAPGDFWNRFFNSKLLKKLKGEKITQADPPDAILDRYLERNEPSPASIDYIPHFIDLEGNEQNHSQRQGNRPDFTMRPSTLDKTPILRVLNNLSEKMLSHVAAEDGIAHGPIGMDEETYDQLQLRDLARVDKDNRIVLNVREQQRLLAGESGDNLSADAARYAKQDPEKVLSTLGAGLKPSQFGSDEHGNLRLDRAIGFDADEDSDDEDEVNGASKSGQRPSHVGSKSAMTSATTGILSSISKRRVAASEDPKSLHGLTTSTFDALATTHNTTTEFLHYFWTLFLSGDSNRAPELQQLVSTLDRSVDRIQAVGKTAEDERQKAIERIDKQAKEYYRKTGKKVKYDYESVGGGGKVAEAMIRPTMGALMEAEARYRKAYEEQTKEQGAVPS